MTIENLGKAYAAGMNRRVTSDCPDADALQVLAARKHHDDASLITMNHVMNCEPCMSAYELMRGVEKAARPTRPFGSRRWPAALAIAATVLIAVAIQRNDAPDAMRGGTSAVQFVNLADEINRSDSLRAMWRSVPGAISYRVELLSSDGQVLATHTTTDSAAVFPPSVLPDNVATIDWFVVARRSDGVELLSPLFRARIH